MVTLRSLSFACVFHPHDNQVAVIPILQANKQSLARAGAAQKQSLEPGLAHRQSGSRL